MSIVKATNDKYMGVKQSRNISGVMFIHFVNSDVKDINPALKEVLGAKKIGSIAEKFAMSDKTSFVSEQDRLILLKRDGDARSKDERIVGAVNAIAGKSGMNGFIVIGAPEMLETVASRSEEMPSGIRVLFGEWAYDGYARKATTEEKAARQFVYGRINDFDYRKFTSVNSNKIEKAVLKTDDQEVELTSYEKLDKMIAKSNKKSIMCPVIELKLVKSKEKGEPNTVIENHYMDRRTESSFMRNMGFDVREALTSFNRKSALYDMQIEYTKDTYVNYDIAYVDLMEKPANPEKQVAQAQAAARTEKMVKDGFYLCVNKEVVVDARGQVVSETESFEWFMTEKEANKMASLNATTRIAKMVPLMASQSQVLNNKAMFINADYKVPEEIIANIEKRLAKSNSIWNEETGIENLYPEYLRSLRGRAAGLEIATYFSFGTKMTNEFVNYVRANHKVVMVNKAMEISGYERKIEGGAAKLNVRASMGATNSVGLLKEGGWDIRTIGSVKYVLTDELLKELMAFYNLSAEKVKAAWKAEKLDGQSIIRKSVLVEALIAAGELRDARTIQARSVSQKGMLVAVEDDLYFQLGFEGDITVEENSYKYKLNKLAQDIFDVALVNREKSINKCHLNYQYINTFGIYGTDEDGNRFNDSSKVTNLMPELVAKSFDYIKNALAGDLVSLLKITGAYQGKETVDLSALGLSNDDDLGTKLALISSLAGSDAIKDGWFKAKVYELFKGSLESLLVGGLIVDGATKYVVSDTTAMLRTDLMARKGEDENTLVDAKGNVLARKNENGKFISVNDVKEMEVNEGDIVISSKDQVALQGLHDCFWGNSPRTGKALLMRVPCTHPGEPQIADLLDARNVVKEIKVLNKDGKEIMLPTRDILASTPDVIIVGGFNVILEALGGADTDGDRLHIILDETVISLRPSYQDVPPCIVEAGNAKEAKVKIGFDMIPTNILNSLKDSGTGLLTDIDTMLLDMAHLLQYYKGTYEGLLEGGMDSSKAEGLVVKSINSIEFFFETLSDIKNAAKDILADADVNKTFFDRKVDGSVDLSAPLTEEKENMTKWSEISLEASVGSINALIALINETCVMLKRLQEKAISSPKTGIYIFFEALGHLTAAKRRPFWYKPGAYKARYNTFIDKSGEDKPNKSVTPMDAVFRSVLAEYEALDKVVYREFDESNYEEDFGFFDGMDDYVDDMFMFDDSWEDEAVKTMAYDVEAEKAKVKYHESGKMSLTSLSFDIEKYIAVSVETAKLGKEYKDAMKKISGMTNPAKKSVAMDNLILDQKESLSALEEKYGFVETYYAAYAPAASDSVGTKIDGTPASYAWVVCADKMAKLLNMNFNEKHILVKKDVAVKKGYTFTKAFDNYVVVSNDGEMNELAMTAIDGVVGVEIISSVHGINKKYNTGYAGAKSALVDNFGKIVDTELTLSVKVNDKGFVELFNGETPVLTSDAQSGTQVATALSPLNGKDIVVKLSNKQAKNFDTVGDRAGKSVKLVVVEVL